MVWRGSLALRGDEGGRVVRLVRDETSSRPEYGWKRGGSGSEGGTRSSAHPPPRCTSAPGTGKAATAAGSSFAASGPPTAVGRSASSCPLEYRRRGRCKPPPPLGSGSSAPLPAASTGSPPSSSPRLARRKLAQHAQHLAQVVDAENRRANHNLCQHLRARPHFAQLLGARSASRCGGGDAGGGPPPSRCVPRKGRTQIA
eukprot:gene18957-biopygen6951